MRLYPGSYTPVTRTFVPIVFSIKMACYEHFKALSSAQIGEYPWDPVRSFSQRPTPRSLRDSSRRTATPPERITRVNSETHFFRKGSAGTCISVFCITNVWTTVCLPKFSDHGQEIRIVKNTSVLTVVHLCWLRFRSAMELITLAHRACETRPSDSQAVAPWPRKSRPGRLLVPSAKAADGGHCSTPSSATDTAKT